MFCVYSVLLFLLFFFFSSRRRHTRCLSDWSSDVCSSDLYCFPAANAIPSMRCTSAESGLRPTAASSATRSEERRVGKECRSRWSTYDEKKKEEKEEEIVAERSRFESTDVESTADDDRQLI